MYLQTLFIAFVYLFAGLFSLESAVGNSISPTKRKAYLKTHIIGQSGQGRQIELLEIKNATQPSLTIYVNALHHGNETITHEVALALSQAMKLAFEKQEDWLDGIRFLIQSQVNPDGYLASTRGDSEGRDINRGYTKKLQTPENHAVDKVLQQFEIDAAVALHSGQRAILWPWANQPLPSDDEKKFRFLASRMASLSGIKKLSSSYHDYPTNGEFIDYAYERYHILAFTYEISWQHELTGRTKSLVIQEVWMALRKLVEGLRLLEDKQAVSH